MEMEELPLVLHQYFIVLYPLLLYHETCHVLLRLI